MSTGTTDARGTVYERLLEAVTNEVAEHGYHGSTVHGICRRAGVSQDEFDAVFAGKHECFIASFRAQADELVAHVRGAIRGAPDWRTGAERGLDAFLDYLARRPAAARACLIEGLLAGPQALAIRDEAMRAFAHLFDIFQEHAPHASATDTPVLSEAAVGGIYEVITSRIRDGRTASLPALREQLTYLVVAQAAGQARARSELCVREAT
jgi:AcrR family transcriptional regulator